jgi:hypothetical protein
MALPAEHVAQPAAVLRRSDVSRSAGRAVAPSNEFRVTECLELVSSVLSVLAEGVDV